MSSYVLQIVHHSDDPEAPPDSQNVIEEKFERIHQAEAAGRRHMALPHPCLRPNPNARGIHGQPVNSPHCETFIFQGDFTIEVPNDTHAEHVNSVEGCPDCDEIEAWEGEGG